jgi:repressor LexA
MRSDLTARQQEVLDFLKEQSTEGAPSPTYREICRHFGYKSPKAAFDHVVALGKKGLLSRAKGSARGIRLVQNVVGIPLFGFIAAGQPQEALTVPDERLNVDPTVYGIHDRSRAFALRVRGNSMIGRQILDGDIVLIEQGVAPRNGDIVAALIDREATLKTFIRQGRKVWLQAENPLFSDLIPVTDLQIQGVARAIIRFIGK